ncbi:MAG TPA: alpha/beta hydrolase [Dehalococcoidia bacterium]|nr:alpha/beta hydrolase [Dehalococcoidia bacterium]
MEQTLTPLLRRVPAGGLQLSVREWSGAGRPFLLVHGLASNAKTWDGVAQRLSSAGHRVVAVDQRGHGLSDKPESGYGFADVTADLRALIDSLDMPRPILAGQSWGGNVVLHFAARYPDIAAGLVLVDGGFIDLSGRPGARWEETSERMRPPNLLGTPRIQMIERFGSFHPGWDADQIEMQMGNYETLEDGTIRPWLTLDRHMSIVRALWDEPPTGLFEHIGAGVLVALAGSGDEERRRGREETAAAAATQLKRAEVKVFEGAPHDIHVDRPIELADWMLDALPRGFFD